MWTYTVFLGLLAPILGAVPTLYEHYTDGGIKSGLETYPDGFLLNGKNITVLSGAVHYFRVHPQQWRDRLRKLRAAGFVAVETYIPWNVHEPRSGEFDFGDGNNDFSMFANFTNFLKIAQEEDLLAIVRPGPWIESEWEGGGMPSWLLRNSKIKLRSSTSLFLHYMNRYFDQVFPYLRQLQFTEGGPIIALQIENEYGLVVQKKHPDTSYLQAIYDSMIKHNLTALKFTMGSPLRSHKYGSLPGVLMTANFEIDAKDQLAELKKMQPNQPFWVTEFYPGWIDNWFDSHHFTRTTEVFINLMTAILDLSSSLNIYMFEGGTTFGFMNGVVHQSQTPTFRFQVTSYDFDGLLTEAGDYTEKYYATAKLIKKYLKVETKLPELPKESTKGNYGSIVPTDLLTIEQLIDQVPATDRVLSENVTAMEMLNINNGSGQSYGFVVYRKKNVTIASHSVLKIMGNVYDMATVMVDGVRKTVAIKELQQVTGFGCWQEKDGELTLEASSGSNRTLDIMVENMGRRTTKKGLYDGDVLLDGQALHDWEIVALQFHTKWVQSLKGWRQATNTTGPALYRFVLKISSAPQDTILNMTTWGKGNVFVNGFNIGRYFSVGPLHSLYLPAPLLREGNNEISVFELYTPASHLTFTTKLILDNK